MARSDEIFRWHGIETPSVDRLPNPSIANAVVLRWCLLPAGGRLGLSSQVQHRGGRTGAIDAREEPPPRDCRPGRSICGHRISPPKRAGYFNVDDAAPPHSSSLANVLPEEKLAARQPAVLWEMQKCVCAIGRWARWGAGTRGLFQGRQTAAESSGAVHTIRQPSVHWGGRRHVRRPWDRRRNKCGQPNLGLRLGHPTHWGGSRADTRTQSQQQI